MAAATLIHLCSTWQSLPNHNRFITKSRPSIRPSITCNVPYSTNKWKRDYTSVMIVPTGVGASIGGFSGDALPVARALSSVVDYLISHPNVLNAAMLYWPMPDVMYVEGYALQGFTLGLWAQRPVHQNKVRLVLDAGIEEHLQIRHLQVVDTTRASLGLPVVEYVVTDTPSEVEKWVNSTTGQSTGRIKLPDSLLRAVKNLVKRSQVDAVAVVGCFSDDEVDDLDSYRHGIVKVSNYWETIGVIAAHKAGIDPNSLRRNRIDNIRCPSIVPANGFAVSRATSIT